MAKKNEYPLNSKYPPIDGEWSKKFWMRFIRRNGEAEGWMYEEVDEEAGHEGHEVLGSVALSGAMGKSKAKLLLYEPVVE
jgi:2,3-dihydroxyphenylpropionate 1,2-dioxygenase